MKEKLEKFTEEMLKEITDLKDLTKEQLPLIAKEYIRYVIICSSILIIFGIMLFITCGITWYYAVTIEHANSVTTTLGCIALVSGLLGLITFSCGVSEILQPLFAPRRFAIKSVTSLFE